MGLSAASDCTLPLLSLLKTRRIAGIHAQVCGRPLPSTFHSSVPSVFMRVCRLWIYACPCRLQTKRNKGDRKRGAESEWTFFNAVITKHRLFFAVSCLHAHLRVFPACSFNFQTLVKIHKPHTRALSSMSKKCHYDEGTSLLHTIVANNHYTLQVRVCLYWGFTPTDEQANAMTQQAECTRGTVCLHQLQRTNYPDYRAVWVYMSVCLCS